MNRIALACMLFAAACSKADDCQRLADRTMALMKDMPMPKGKDLGDAKTQFVEMCRKDPKKYTTDPDAKCILEASSDSAAADCLKKGMEEYRSKSKVSEAPMNLNRIGKGAKIAFVETSAFPKGKAKVLPADNGAPGCCGDAAKTNKCAVSTEWASDPVWKALDFQIDEPTMYRYSYESTDGKTFTVTAVGDTDCDGETATYTLTGTIDSAGNPTVNLARPENGKF